MDSCHHTQIHVIIRGACLVKHADNEYTAEDH